MRIKVELTSQEVRNLIVDKIQDKVGGANPAVFKPQNVKVEVKTTQNYKAEWEVGEFRVSYEGDV